MLKVVWVFRVSLPLHLDITREKSIHLYLMMALLRNKSPKKALKYDTPESRIQSKGGVGC